MIDFDVNFLFNKKYARGRATKINKNQSDILFGLNERLVAGNPNKIVNINMCHVVYIPYLV